MKRNNNNNDNNNNESFDELLSKLFDPTAPVERRPNATNKQRRITNANDDANNDNDDDDETQRAVFEAILIGHALDDCTPDEIRAAMLEVFDNTIDAFEESGLARFETLTPVDVLTKAIQSAPVSFICQRVIRNEIAFHFVETKYVQELIDKRK